MFLGWMDADKKRKPAVKVQQACERYAQKNGRPPRLVLTNPAHVDELQDIGIEVHGRSYIARNVFYVGEEQDRAAG